MGIAEMTLTPEKLDELERALQVKLDAEKRLRANLTSKNLAALDAADAQLGVLLDDNAEELVRAAKERDAQAARIAEREKPCVWTPEGEDSSSWNTGCGSSFWFDDGHEGVNFCPFCGHPAVFDHEGDEA